jgi:hypothetical protein
MGGRPRGRPRGDRPRQPARPKQPGAAPRKQPAGHEKTAAGRGGRAARALNPRRTATPVKVRLAAIVFAALGFVLGILGTTVDRNYLKPAVLTLLLAVLWGVRGLMMR